MNRNKLAFIICLALGIIGVQLYASTPSTKPDLVINRSNNTATTKPAPNKATAKIKVQISGAIVMPGIYELNKGSRVEELVQLAGGLSADADRDKANLAKNLKDGMLISIPYKKQSRTNTTASSSRVNSPANNPATSSNTTININTADAKTLQSLNGIGPVLSERITSYRQQNGRFNSKQDLLKVTGIGSKLLDKIADQITLD